MVPDLMLSWRQSTWHDNFHKKNSIFYVYLAKWLALSSLDMCMSNWQDTEINSQAISLKISTELADMSVLPAQVNLMKESLGDFAFNRRIKTQS